MAWLKKHVTFSEKNIEENNGKNITQLTFFSYFIILYPKIKTKRFPKKLPEVSFTSGCMSSF